MLVLPLGAVELPVDFFEAVPDVPAPGPYPSWNLPGDERAVRECCAQPRDCDVLWLNSFSSHAALHRGWDEIVRLGWPSLSGGAVRH